MKQQVAEKLRSQLHSLRPVLLTDSDHTFLDLFDQFIQQCEFGLALNVVCDYILQPDSPMVSKLVIDQIDRLRAAMEMDDLLVKELRNRQLGWTTRDQPSF
jgi:hypothetical protein